MSKDRVYPKRLAALEAWLIRRRRRLANVPTKEPFVGFALSGGGIRSATFCLGVFQALARRHLVQNIDVLSTVSGGGYFGGFLGALFSRIPAPMRDHQDAKLDVRAVEDTLADSSSHPVHWLRQNGRYLSPAGAGDALLALAVHLRNFVSLHIIIGVAAVTVLLAGVAARPAVAPLGVATTVTWSPWVTLAVVPLLLLATPAGWAYWLTQRRRRGLPDPAPVITTVALVVGCLALEIPGLGLRPAVDSHLGWSTIWPARVLGSLAVLALAIWGIEERLARRGDRADPRRDLEFSLLWVRNRLSQLTKAGVVVAAVLLAFGAVDSLGQSLYRAIAEQGLPRLLAKPWTWPPLAAVLAALAAARRVASALPSQQRLQVPWQVAAWAAAVIVVTLMATVWAATAYAVVWGGVVPHDSLPYGRAALGAAAGLLLSVALGRAMQFVNNSSYHAMYAARLTRAYLGASNPVRWSGRGSRISEVARGDAIGSQAYRPHAYGGPLHLVNVTVNETIGGQDQIEYRDRKGLAMAVGPVGVSIGASHHARWALGPRISGQGRELRVRRLGIKDGAPGAAHEAFHPLFRAREWQHTVQSRQVGHWMAISGAAFTTGLGSRTSLPLALLLGLANVRLGYWWDSHTTPGTRAQESAPTAKRRVMRVVERLFPIQTGLLDELLGRFWGTAKTYWYLSDGGHFENTGCYELLRRRLPLIVCCDCGADPDYTWTDLGNLVRKARIDFGAEIRFLTAEELDRHLWPDRRSEVCESHEIIPAKRRFDRERGKHELEVIRWARGHAIVAHVHYLDDGDTRQRYEADPHMTPDSVLVIVKPSLTGDEPADVLEYARSHPSFPHESTLDQYFDEAQWESYRRLGEHVGERLFRRGAGWCPVKVAGSEA